VKRLLGAVVGGDDLRGGAVRLLHPLCRVSSGSRRRWPFLSMGRSVRRTTSRNGRFSFNV
jgi:hypothetical protein